MAITQAVPTSFKTELLQGIHDFTTDTFRVALYSNSSANLGAATTVYTSTGEVSGIGYTAGGSVAVVSSGFPQASGTSGAARFNDVIWTGATFSADGALIYNASKGNRAVLVLAFPAPQSPVAGQFTLRFPTSLPPIINIA